MPNKDFVSRQWLIDEYHRRHKGPPGGALKMIEEAPAADVAPVIRAKWLHTKNFSGLKCSNCKARVKNGAYRTHGWCYKCGAKMEGSNDES